MTAASLFSEPIVQRLGWTLVHSLWQGVLIAAALAGVLRLLRAAPANVRYAASCAAMSMMVVAAVFTFTRIRVAPAPIAEPRWIGLIAAAKPQAVTMAAPLPAAPPAEPETVTRQETRLDVLRLVVACWAVGVALMSLWHVGGWLWLRRMRRGTPLTTYASVMERLTTRLSLSRAVALLETVRIDVPAVVGVLRPVILVPAGVLSGLTPQQIEAILAHELAHVRRHDYLVNLIQAAIETLMFYHPATWWISAQIRQERENCCDDIAAAVCGDRIAYASALAALEVRRGVTRWVARRMAPAAAGGNLLARVRRVLDLPPRARHNRICSLAAAMLAVACMALPLVVTAGEQAHTEPPAPPASRATSQPSEFNFVEIVIAQDSMLHQGKPIDIDALKQLLEGTPLGQRRKTVLAISAASPNVTVERFFSATGALSQIVKDYELAYLSETGINRSPEAQKVEQFSPLAPQSQYFVSGSVVRPGVYSVAPGQEVNVKQAIAAAGGPTTDVPEVTVGVIRREGGREVNAMENVLIGDLFGGKQKDIAVLPGDIIRVSSPPAGEYYIDGQVARTGVYSLTARKITVKQAVAAAGGIGEGKEAYISIIRREGRNEIWPMRDVRYGDILSGKHGDEYLQPNDVVRILAKPMASSPPATQPRSNAGPAPAPAGAGAEADRARELWRNAIDAEAEQDYARAIRYLEAIKKLPADVQPPTLDVRLNWARHQIPVSAETKPGAAAPATAPATAPAGERSRAGEEGLLQTYFDQRAMLEVQIASLKQQVGSAHPALRNAQAMLDDLNKRIATARAYSSATPERIAQNDPTMREYLRTLEQMELSLQQLGRNVGTHNPMYISREEDIKMQKRRIDTYAETFRKTFPATTQP
jgi:beta-lactamase regulating signal transducer with metallopeptidase domain/protein involved in polysaccharide export with SLBB domain